MGLAFRLAVVALVVAGCSATGSSDGSAEASLSSSVVSTAEVATAPTSPPAPPTTVAPVDQDVDEIDFDALYRELDADRTRAWDTNDADLLATISPNPQDLDALRERASTGEHLVRRPGREYRIDAVNVFDKLGDDDVLLRVVDTIQGVTDVVDAEGEVIRSYSRTGNLQQAFIVWMHRSDDGWMILSDDGGFAITLPAGPAEFEEMARLEVGGREVVLSGAVVGIDLCLLATYPDSVPWVHCFDLDPASPTRRFADSRYHLDIDERYELVVAVGHDLDADQFELRTGSMDPVRLNLAFGDRHRFAVLAAEPGTFDVLDLGAATGVGLTETKASPPTDLDTLRTAYRESRSLFPER